MQFVKLSFNGNYFLSYIFINDQNKLPIKKPGLYPFSVQKIYFGSQGQTTEEDEDSHVIFTILPQRKRGIENCLVIPKKKTGYRWRWSWREIASSNFAKDSTTSARFCVVSNSNKYFFIHHLVRDTIWPVAKLFIVQCWGSRMILKTEGNNTKPDFGQL